MNTKMRTKFGFNMISVGTCTVFTIKLRMKAYDRSIPEFDSFISKGYYILEYATTSYPEYQRVADRTLVMLMKKKITKLMHQPAFNEAMLALESLPAHACIPSSEVELEYEDLPF